MIDHHPPGPSNLSGRIGYVMNLVTVPRHRRRGIARRVMRVILKWLTEQGIQRVELHATESVRNTTVTSMLVAQVKAILKQRREK